ncbi:MAG: efflux RND transporter permease subunit [Phycisphaerae bacterium]
MFNLVRLALRRPITILVLIMSVVLVSILAIKEMPRDIFPDLGVPIIYVAQPYGGMSPAQMEGYIARYYEANFLYVSGIESIETKSIQGLTLVRLQFYPGTNMARALAQTVSYANRAKAYMPPGTVPPFIMRFSTGSLPVGDLVFSSKTRSLAQLQDLVQFRVRPLFATLPGVSAPDSFGASKRSIVINLKPDRLRAYALTPDQIVAAVKAANVIVPSGNVQIGQETPLVQANAVVGHIQSMLTIPLKFGTTRTVYLGDVASVEDASDITVGYALVNGRKTIYMPVTKLSGASTLAVVDTVKANLPKFQAMMPSDVKIRFEFDQSPYVTRSIANLLSEAALGAVLTGLMVLLFLGDWRSTVIVLITIPISLLCAMVALWITGQTVNLMTLGGLALAVGIIVDTATVTIENMHTHLDRGKSIARAALDSTIETDLPRLLAVLCIVAVFIPAFFMQGAPRALFIPLSLSVAFAMGASYLLSSTLVPMLSIWMLGEQKPHAPHAGKYSFAAFQRRYKRVVQALTAGRIVLLGVYFLVCGAIIILVTPRIGTQIFPTVYNGQFEVRLRAPTGTDIDSTLQITRQVLAEIKRQVGPKNLELTLSYVGLQPADNPIGPIYLWTAGPEDAVLDVQLHDHAPVDIQKVENALRLKLASLEPGVRFSFDPSDIINRVMSFGASNPVEVDVSGRHLKDDLTFARKIKAKLLGIDALKDVQIEQSVNYPTLNLDIDRARAGLFGLTTRSIMDSVLEATASSRYVTPIFWADPLTGISYRMQVQVPQRKMKSLQAVQNILVGALHGQGVLLRNMASVKRAVSVEEYDRVNMQREISITANVNSDNLGGVAARVRSAIAAVGKPPHATTVHVAGQIPIMEQILSGLGIGLLAAIVVIFLMLAANFQSFKLAVAIILTMPAVIAGVVLALYLTATTLNIQSFMGAIMAVGIAVANSILLVTFAEQYRRDGMDSVSAAVEGAGSRLRPILMTSIAMIAGMVPMAMGLAESGQQSAPIGRAVIGGLVFATMTTLLVLPSIYAVLQRKAQIKTVSLDPDDPSGAFYEVPLRHD